MVTNLFKIEHTTLPQRVRAILDVEQVDNFALKLNKCANFLATKQEQRQKTDDLAMLNDSAFASRKAYFYIAKYGKKDTDFRQLEVLPNFPDWALSQAQDELTDATHICAKQANFEFKLDWRLAIGMGTGSVFENGLILHHIYGIPYLPASSIKGIVNHYAQDLKQQETEDYKAIFGNENQQGKVIFFDAFPKTLSKTSVQPDIMNNHFQEYYNGTEAPADWHQPIPVFFLTLKDIRFKFTIGILLPDYQPLLSKVSEWLKQALEIKGIGAKTAVGYGAMRQETSDLPIEANALSSPTTIEEIPLILAIEPAYLQKKSLNPKKRYVMEGIITKSGVPNTAKIYVYEGFIQENVKIDLMRNPIEENTIITIDVAVDKQGKVTQASYKGKK